MLRDLPRPARHPGAPARRRAAIALLGGLLSGLAGCGGHGEKPAQDLSFEQLPDTTGLTRGAPIVESLEASRMSSGAVRVTGHVRLPDGTKLQIAIKQPGGRVSVAMAQVFVQGERFDTPPLLGESGPLPRGTYRLELLGHFDHDWQSANVMRVMEGGLALRGPGITRARDGSAALFLTREARL
jgi:hypothetical protein